MKSEILTVVTVALFGTVDWYKRFGGSFYLHFQG
jgi:hypothetical protein